MAGINDTSLGKTMGEAMVQVGEDWLDRICPLVKGDRRVVRINVIAFCTFSLIWSLEKKLTERQLVTVTSAVIEGAVARAGVGPFPKVVEMFRNRHEELLVAVANLQYDELALSKFFSACCSVNRTLIRYMDILPDPEALEEMGKTAGGLTDHGRSLLEKIRATPSPAIYSMDPFKSVRLVDALMGLLEHIKAGADRLKR